MSLSKASELRKLSSQELEDEILSVKRQLFDLRFQRGTRRLEKTHEIKHKRHRLAQLLTVERERQLATENQQNEAVAETVSASQDD
jgi:large subunit ribosomal protein L29